MEITESDAVVPMQLSGRKKRKLMTKIKTQMEFYFSDSNIAKDKFLRNLIENDPDGYVDLEVFKSFNKINALTTDIDIISRAVSKSELLKLSDDKTRIRRKTTASSSKDYDACTLYAERLPPFADHKWIKDVFEHFGNVDYVNIPRFKVTKKIKGFAFIEFSNPESVAKACEYYQNAKSKAAAESKGENDESKNGNIKKAEGDPLRNSKKRKTSFDTKQSFEKECESHATTCVSKNIKKEEMLDDEKHSSQSNKKRKHDNCGAQKSFKKHCAKDITSDHEESKNIVSKEQQLSSTENPSATETDPISDVEIAGKSKRKRKHKKKSLRDERPLLRVMSKHEWKVYRNKYLELQRSTMSKLKKQIMLETQEWKEHETSSKAENPSESPKKALQFQPGVIIKIILSDPIESVNDIKDQVKASAVVAYIDAPLGHSEMFVRCHSSNDAQSIIQEGRLKNLGSVKLLIDAEEEDYWKKIENDKKIKFSMPPTHKKRGRDKIIAKAAKLAEQKNKHIYFDE